MQKRYCANVYSSFVRVMSNGEKAVEMANFQILSPVRLPFRHTGDKPIAN